MPELFGYSDKYANGYALQGSFPREIFLMSERLLLLEIVNHLFGIKEMKPEMAMFALWANFICHLVIPFYMTVSASFSSIFGFRRSINESLLFLLA